MENKLGALIELSERFDLPELLDVVIFDDPWFVFDEDGKVILDW